jgi:ribosomal-protein-alanine N-acetyltransferase
VRLHAIFTLPGVRRYIFDDEIIPPHQTAEIVEKSVALFRDRGLGLWIAERCMGPHVRPSPPSMPSGPSIGFGGFWFFRDPPELELLYGVVDDEAGRGYGGEIASALIGYGFDALKMPAIRASCDAGHAVSRRLLDRLGFRFERQDVVGGLDTAFYELRKTNSPPLPA